MYFAPGSVLSSVSLVLGYTPHISHTLILIFFPYNVLSCFPSLLFLPKSFQSLGFLKRCIVFMFVAISSLSSGCTSFKKVISSIAPFSSILSHNTYSSLASLYFNFRITGTFLYNGTSFCFTFIHPS